MCEGGKEANDSNRSEEKYVFFHHHTYQLIDTHTYCRVKAHCQTFSLFKCLVKSRVSNVFLQSASASASASATIDGVGNVLKLCR